MQKRSMAAGASPDQRAAVVSKATLNAAEKFGVTSSLLARVLGLSEPTISRMRKGDYVLAHGSKEYELALLFLRLFRSVDAILGGDDASVRSWMTMENTVLHAKPVDLIVSIQGLMETVSYVDSRRAPI